MARTKKKRPEKRLVQDRIAEMETAIAGVLRRARKQPTHCPATRRGAPENGTEEAEEATEVVIEAIRRERAAVIHESVDLIYNLVVLWSELGITAPEVWAEMDRR